MADVDKVQNTDPETFHAELEVDSVVSSQGSGYYDADACEEGSRISGPQPLTGHPPLQNEVGGEHRLVSNIERDGRLESRDRLDDFIQAKRRATEEMDKVYQICEDLHAENERLRREGGLCRDCRALLTGPVTENERTIDGQNQQRELREAKVLIEQLQHRCKVLLDQVARLNNGSHDEAEGDQQHSSTAGARERGLTTPKQTESIGNALQSVDPIVRAVNERRTDIVEGSMIPGGAPAQTANAGVEERPRTPSPEDCAIFLADVIKPGEIKTLFRNLSLSSVTIADLDVRHPKDPKEYRIDGIKTGIVSANGDRVSFLLDALEKSKLNHQADLFCDEFNIQHPLKVLRAVSYEQGAQSTKQPLQASSTDDFADSPCLEPLSDFETVLQPFLNDPTSIHTIAVELSKEADFTTSQLKHFKASFPGWKLEHRTKLEKECLSRCTMDVLNVWASVQVERMKGPNPAQGIEYLAKALRASGRITILEKLKGYLHKGVVGPSLKRDLYLRKIYPYRLKVEIIKYLGLKKEAGRDDWRALTEDIGHGDQIKFWEQEPHPAETLWNAWQTRNDATIGKLYAWAIRKSRLDIAALLEKEAENTVQK